MGTVFEQIAYNPAKCGKEIRALGQLLKTKSELSERRDILPFFKARRQLSAFLGTFAPDIGPAPEIAYEYSFLGDYSADLVVGNRATKEYLVIEFEDDRDSSIFKKVRSRSTTNWSARFDHGFSQLVDWFYTLDDYKKTDKFKKEFGSGHISFSGLLVIGRNAGVSETDRVRLAWRTEKVIVDSHPISCITFDQLHHSLNTRLAYYPAASKVGN